VLRKKSDVEGILNDEFAPLLRATEDALRDLWDNSDDDVWDGVVRCGALYGSVTP